MKIFYTSVLLLSILFTPIKTMYLSLESLKKEISSRPVILQTSDGYALPIEHSVACKLPDFLKTQSYDYFPTRSIPYDLKTTQCLFTLLQEENPTALTATIEQFSIQQLLNLDVLAVKVLKIPYEQLPLLLEKEIANKTKVLSFEERKKEYTTNLETLNATDNARAFTQYSPYYKEVNFFIQSLLEANLDSFKKITIITKGGHATDFPNQIASLSFVIRDKITSSKTTEPIIIDLSDFTLATIANCYGLLDNAYQLFMHFTQTDYTDEIINNIIEEESLIELIETMKCFDALCIGIPEDYDYSRYQFNYTPEKRKQYFEYHLTKMQCQVMHKIITFVIDTDDSKNRSEMIKYLQNNLNESIIKKLQEIFADNPAEDIYKIRRHLKWNNSKECNNFVTNELIKSQTPSKGANLTESNNDKLLPQNRVGNFYTYISKKIFSHRLISGSITIALIVAITWNLLNTKHL